MITKSDTNLFLSWMNKEKCELGDHIHPGRLYCHPIDRIHPQIQILGPHPGTQELGDQEKPAKIGLRPDTQRLGDKRKGASKISTQTVRDMLSNHPNKQIRDIAKKAYEYDLSKTGSIDKFIKENKLGDYNAHEALRVWQEGADQIIVRAALYELQNTADEKYATENAFFVQTKKKDPSVVEKRYKRGREIAVALIPYIIKTQQVLRRTYPNGFIPAVYRGITGEMANKIEAATKNAKPGDIVVIPHDGSSSYSLSKKEAQRFGRVLLVKQNIPINQALIFFNAFDNKYEDEQEIILNSDAVTFFAKDEIII